jgi:hypothetical protein
MSNSMAFSALPGALPAFGFEAICQLVRPTWVAKQVALEGWASAELI